MNLDHYLYHQVLPEAKSCPSHITSPFAQRTGRRLNYPRIWKVITLSLRELFLWLCWVVSCLTVHPLRKFLDLQMDTSQRRRSRPYGFFSTSIQRLEARWQLCAGTTALGILCEGSEDGPCNYHLRFTFTTLLIPFLRKEIEREREAPRHSTRRFWVHFRRYGLRTCAAYWIRRRRRFVTG